MPQEAWGPDVPDLVVTTPLSWRLEHTPSPDFDVYYFVEPIGTDSALTRVGVFVGMHPDLSSYEAGVLGPVGCIAGREVEWHNARAPTDAGRWKSETVLENVPGLPEPADAFRLHIWAFAADSVELVESRSWASTLSFDR